ncbi:hypothetical protein Lal_00033912 [Lupinus albus]|nr:hypothetical protein Lal_00033912 [Lupinus albus]
MMRCAAMWWCVAMCGDVVVCCDVRRCSGVLRWSYNPEDRKDRVSKEEAILELIDVIESTIPPENFIPRIVERTEDYIRVEYESPILGLVDDVEFWFRPGKDSIVEYRSASRFGDYDFEVNRKRIKALRLELEKRGWVSQDTMQIPYQI